MKYKLNSDFHSIAGEVELSNRVFGSEVSQSAIYELIKNQQTNKRQGNSSSKNIAMISSRSTKKPWRQKGTGNARAGTKKSPVWVGGAVAFGPHKRDFSYQINKKVRKKAIFSLLSDRVKNETFYVLGDIAVEEYKTKKIVDFFSPFRGEDKNNRVLLIVSSKEKNYGFIKKSSANLIWMKVVNVEAIEVKDLFYADQVIFSKFAVEFLNQLYGDASETK